jgi:type IV pilus assembly protein PilB
MGLPAFMVATTIKCVLAQRLCRRVCKDCKAQRPPSPEEIEVFKLNNVEIPPGGTIAYGKGCDTCGGSGFKGRCGIHELLVMDDSVRTATLKDVSADHIRNTAVRESPQKMRLIIQDGLFKVLSGLTTVREVLGGAAEDEGKK